MSKKITMEVGLPSVIGGTAKEMRVDIARDPAGDFEPSESMSVDADADSINIEANAGSHVTVSVRAIDDEGQSSKPITKRFQANDPLCPELANDMTVEVGVTDNDAAPADELTGDDDPPAEPTGEDDPPADAVESTD